MVKRKRQFDKPETLCFSCANAVPCAEKRKGCEWSILGKPVPGWKAKCTGTSYRVNDCPKYERG